jgi:hypothetical protein
MKYRHDKLMIVCLGFSLLSCLTADAQNTSSTSTVNEPSPISVSVYVSSFAGDRLAKQPDMQFTPHEKSSLPLLKSMITSAIKKLKGSEQRSTKPE